MDDWKPISELNGKPRRALTTLPNYPFALANWTGSGNPQDDCGDIPQEHDGQYATHFCEIPNYPFDDESEAVDHDE